MRKVKQITLYELDLFALCEDGTIWRLTNLYSSSADDEDWTFIEGPPEGRPEGKPLTLEEQAEHLRSIGNRTYAGRGHHLGKGGNK